MIEINDTWHNESSVKHRGIKLRKYSDARSWFNLHVQKIITITSVLN